MPTFKRVVITGIGAISPFGRGAPVYFDGLREGRSGLRRLSLFEDAALASQVAGEVPEFDPLNYMEPQEIKRVPRVVPMAIGTAREALVDAGIRIDEKGELADSRIGVLIGTGGGGIEFAERQYKEFFENHSRKVTPYCVSSSFVGMLSSEISIALKLHGISHVISTGCTSSTDAIGYAYRMIRWGEEKRLLTGGAEACITPGLMAGFCQMRVMASRYNATPERASRPFDRERDGFVLGEGAWMFVVESLDSARARGAKIYAEIIGYGSTCEAYHRVAAKEDGVEPARAMRLALEESDLEASDVQCIQLHGTATKMNDTVETRAVKLLFDKLAVKIHTTALKSMIGHPQGACGAAGVLSAVFALKEQFIPPTINYENPDPECDLNYTPNKGVSKDVEHVLCNTIAFGSKNSALALKRVGQKGSALFPVFVFLFIIALAFFAYLLSQPGGVSRIIQNNRTVPTDARDAKIAQLEGEISQLYISLDQAEAMRDRDKYMEIATAMEAKFIESDDLWEEKTRSRKGLVDGMMGGLSENYESRFTAADKFQMLSEKYGLPVEQIRALKADTEILFSQELAEKFTLPQDESEQA